MGYTISPQQKPSIPGLGAGRHGEERCYGYNCKPLLIPRGKHLPGVTQQVVIPELALWSTVKECTFTDDIWPKPSEQSLHDVVTTWHFDSAMITMEKLGRLVDCQKGVKYGGEKSKMYFILKYEYFILPSYLFLRVSSTKFKTVLFKF